MSKQHKQWNERDGHPTSEIFWKFLLTLIILSAIGVYVSKVVTDHFESGVEYHQEHPTYPHE